MVYTPPLKEMLFVMQSLAGLSQVQALPGFEEATDDTVNAILEENARFMAQVVAPLNRVGDTQGPVWENGQVKATPGFAEAFAQFTQAGWQGLAHPAVYGGQGLPKLVATPCLEMLQSANLSFALCPLLTDGAIEALLTVGSEAQRARYVPELIEGRWTGTMNLTEPQAGSDLSLIRTRAQPQADGSYRLFGQKIFITWGEHDMAENIVHLVLARMPDAPEGVKGISLFLVPKFLVNDDGSLGARNDVYCASIEHKLGIHGSPTAVLLYGDNKGEVGAGAIGFLVGEAHRGLEYMFIMMNAARFQVGIQAIGVAQRAYEQAVAYARDRVQGRALAGSAGPVAIIHHPDVRRLLMSMRANIESMRAVAYVAAAYGDQAHHHPEPQRRQEAKALYEFLVPIVKGCATEMSIEVASAGVQVHGGMGFIEETGAAQYYRDARILTIYEGTTAIQANDFLGRKTLRDGGQVARALIGQMRDTVQALANAADPDVVSIRAALAAGIEDFEAVVEAVCAWPKQDIMGLYAGSVPYLRLAGLVLGGWQMARAAQCALAELSKGVDTDFMQAKLTTARFYADHVLSASPGLRASVIHGAPGVLSLEVAQF